MSNKRRADCSGLEIWRVCARSADESGKARVCRVAPMGAGGPPRLPYDTHLQEPISQAERKAIRHLELCQLAQDFCALIDGEPREVLARADAVAFAGPSLASMPQGALDGDVECEGDRYHGRGGNMLQAGHDCCHGNAGCRRESPVRASQLDISMARAPHGEGEQSIRAC